MSRVAHRATVAILACAFFLAHFHRVCPGVLSADLQRSLRLDATGLGLVSATYFYAYGFMQIPVGALVDRYGARRLATFLTLVASAGAVLFGVAPNLPAATVARALVGVGASGIYVPALRLLGHRLHPRQFATAVGIMTAAGNLGGVAATLPLQFLKEIVGWRMTFIFLAAVSAVVAALMWTSLDDTPDRQKRGAADGSRAETGGVPLKRVLSEPALLRLGFVLLGRYGPHMAFLGTWGFLYLTKAHSLTPIAAGNGLMAMSIGYAIGGPFFGYVSDRIVKRRRPVILCTASVCLVSWIFLLMARNELPAPLLVSLTLAMGVAGGGNSSVVFCATKEQAHPRYVGTALAIVNTMAFLGAAVCQLLTGYLIDAAAGVVQPAQPAQHGHMASFRGPLLTCVVATFLALLCAIRTRETLAYPAKTNGGPPDERRAFHCNDVTSK